MRVVNFRDDVVYPIAHLLGLDPLSVDFQNEHARKIVAALNSNLRYAWEFWDWPELNLTEERAFRPIYDPTAQYLRNASTNEPDEFFYITSAAGDVPTTGDYYRVLTTVPIDPPIGTLPTNTTYFELIPAPIDRYVAFDQAGKQSIGRIFSIYNSSPRVSPPALSWGHALSENGIDLPWIAGPTAWLKYQVRPSQFSAAAYAASTTYTRGQVVYDPTTGNCYRALKTTHGAALTLTTSWQLQEFPYALSEYVKYATAADVAEDQQQASIWRSEAREYLYREIDKLIEQGQRFFYDIRGLGCNRVPLGLSGFWWSVAAPDTLPVFA